MASAQTLGCFPYILHIPTAVCPYSHGCGRNSSGNPVMQQGARGLMHPFLKRLLVSCLLITRWSKQFVCVNPEVKVEGYSKSQYYDTGRSLIGTVYVTQQKISLSLLSVLYMNFQVIYIPTNSVIKLMLIFNQCKRI